ncbi:MAG TPA: twin-arginine translocation signal domain-containing protein [Myxococcales bacterium]|nr:twin-arginine translocation signal domain-containing protein [Myxococcales bacterium]
MTRKIDRRRFIQAASAATLGAGLLGCNSIAQPGHAGLPLRTAGPNLWGVPSAAQMQAMLPQSAQAQSMLEVFLLGGLNPWDTFYVVPEHGHASQGDFARHQWWTFQNQGELTLSQAAELCGGGKMPLYEPFSTDSNGKTINLGPFIYPLRQRPDILARMRVYVLRHDIEPHEGAVPLAVTGSPLGAPALCSTGAHFERHFRGLGGNTHLAPYSYVIQQPSASANENFEVATATGLHHSHSRPLGIRLGPHNDFVKRLHRASVGKHGVAFDQALKHYLSEYRAGLNFHANGQAIRA